MEKTELDHAVDDVVNALKAWQFYYEGHSTAENRDMAFWVARQALYRYKHAKPL